MNKTLADRIIEAREKKGLTQEQLADLIPMKQQSLSQIETGETKTPRFLKRISDVLETSPAWLMFGEGASPDYDKIKVKEPDAPYNSKACKIPIVKWYEIPEISKNPGLLFNDNVVFLDLTFPKEKNLFASQVPLLITPGKSDGFFIPNDYLLISPERQPVSNNPVVIIEDGYPDPVYAFYWQKGRIPYIKYPDEIHSREINSKMHICGVVVSRLSIFI